MYITSKHLQLISQEELKAFEDENKLKLPKHYADFLTNYGTGTYGGAIYIYQPNVKELKGYAKYKFWNHKEAPITNEQIEECAVIGASIDSDFIAVHPNVSGYILLPRNSDNIKLFHYNDDGFTNTIEEIGLFLFREKLDDFFETSNINTVCFRFTKTPLKPVVNSFKSNFKHDYLVQNKYVCQVFFIDMGGSVRFNLSNSYTIVSYADYGVQYFEVVKKHLIENGFELHIDS